jgi:GC-rich sequence DNA-binding factor
MSDTPVIFKRSKAKANQRAREEPQQDAQEQRVQSIEDEPSPSALVSKIKNKTKQRVKPKTSLSFGVEEEVCQRQHDTSFLTPHHGSQEGNQEVFKIKKSNLSQKLTLRQHPASQGQGCVCCPYNSEFRAYRLRGIRRLPSNLDQASISTHTTRGPVYDEAYLNELKASTPSSRPRIPEGGAPDDDTLVLSTPGDVEMESLDSIGNGLRARPSVLLYTDILSLYRFWSCDHTFSINRPRCQREARAHTYHWLREFSG